ncbi:MAG: lipoprotein insertase outer membrane protein LolB [Sterolibacterium sp.]
MTYRLRQSLLALMVMLTGCAQLPGSTTGSGIAPRPTRMAIDAFTLAGRIAIHQEQRHYAVNISWQHTPESDEIMLATPLGQGVAELTRNAAGTRLIAADRREYNAPDWQALGTRMFGLDLPLAHLPRWLVGDVPTDALGVKYDGMGRPQQWVADGWLVNFLGYESGAADALPSLIELNRGEIEVRLKIDDWQLPP